MLKKLSSKVTLAIYLWNMVSSTRPLGGEYDVFNLSFLKYHKFVLNSQMELDDL